jgi:predicted kinase
VPALILVMGVAGSGKTTLSLEIVRRLMAVYLDNNHIADPFFPNTRETREYRRFRTKFYEALYSITDANLALGNSVLLDVPHITDVQRPEWKNQLRRLVRKRKAKLVVIRCTCTEQTLRERLRTRGERRDHWKLRHWKKFMVQEPPAVRIPFPHLDIDTDAGLAGNVADAVAHIRREGNVPLRRSKSS